MWCSESKCLFFFSISSLTFPVVDLKKEMLECRSEKLNAYQYNTRQLEQKKEKLEKSKTPQPKLEKEIEEVSFFFEIACLRFLHISSH